MGRFADSENVAQTPQRANISDMGFPTYSIRRLVELQIAELTGAEGSTMKQIAIALLAGVAAVVGLNQGASAADLPVKAAPPPAPVPVWTGFYVGVHAGAAWQSAPNWTLTDPNPGFFPTTGLASDDKEGA